MGLTETLGLTETVWLTETLALTEILVDLTETIWLTETLGPTETLLLTETMSQSIRGTFLRDTLKETISLINGLVRFTLSYHDSFIQAFREAQRQSSKHRLPGTVLRRQFKRYNDSETMLEKETQ